MLLLVLDQDLNQIVFMIMVCNLINKIINSKYSSFNHLIIYTDTNFCNIFNLFRNGNASQLNFDLSIRYGNCAFHPDTQNSYNPAYAQCDKY